MHLILIHHHTSSRTTNKLESKALCSQATMSFSYRHDEDEPSDTYNITGVAISNKSILILSAIGFGLLGFVFYFLILRRLSSIDDHAEQQENARRDVYGEMLDQSDVATLNRAQRRARAKFRMKKAAEGIDGDDGGAANGEGGVMRENVGGNHNLEETNLSRKERQKAAREMEREERKLNAEEARVWREKKQSTMKSEGSRCDGKEKMAESSNKESELSLGEIFPRRKNVNDAFSEFLFWESIMKKIKEKANSYDEMISSAHQMPKMTIREFVERLKQNGSVSIATLADEFGGISVPEVLIELENINKQHGIIGVPDANGNFVYVSTEMIKLAIKLGNDAGRISYPD